MERSTPKFSGRLVMEKGEASIDGQLVGGPSGDIPVAEAARSVLTGFTAVAGLRDLRFLLGDMFNKRPEVSKALKTSAGSSVFWTTFEGEMIGGADLVLGDWKGDAEVEKGSAVWHGIQKIAESKKKHLARVAGLDATVSAKETAAAKLPVNTKKSEGSGPRPAPKGAKVRKKNSGQGQRFAGRCFRCNGLGHRADECWSAAR